MPISQKRSKKKVSGGKYHKIPKRVNQLAGAPALTKVGERRAKLKREIGGNKKTTLLQNNIINVLDPKTKKYQKTEILSVVENPANRNFVRRNIMTKGCIVETKIGKAKLTSRPGQEGTVNGILVK